MEEHVIIDPTKGRIQLFVDMTAGFRTRDSIRRVAKNMGLPVAYADFAWGQYKLGSRKTKAFGRQPVQQSTIPFLS
jgi:hypothetical protein